MKHSLQNKFILLFLTFCILPLQGIKTTVLKNVFIPESIVSCVCSMERFPVTTTNEIRNLHVILQTGSRIADAKLTKKAILNIIDILTLQQNKFPSDTYPATIIAFLNKALD